MHGSSVYEALFALKNNLFPFVSTKNWANETSPIVLLNERKRSPNDKNLAKTHNLFEIGYKCACESGTAFSLRSLYVLFVATGFHEISQHVRVITCHSVVMIKNSTSVSLQ